MSHPKYSGLADQITHRRLSHIHKFQGAKKAPEKAETETGPKQLGIFEDTVHVEVYHQYDGKTREVEWAFYTSDGRFLLQFGFSLVDRSYQIYSLHAALFQEQEEMGQIRKAINRHLNGHYPSLELAWDPGADPQIRRKAAPDASPPS